MASLQLTKERKFLFISGIILLLGGLIYRFDMALPFAGSHDELALKQKAIIKYQNAIHEKTNLEKELLNLEKILKRAESVLLRRDTAALAAVDIQNSLQNITGRIGAKVDSMRVLKSQKTEGENYLIIPVQCTVKTTMRQLKEILYQIENSSLLLKISDLRLKAIKRGGTNDMVLTTLTVAGYMKASPAVEDKTKQ